MANDVNARLLVQILANNADFIKGMQSSQKQISSFTTNVTKLAGTLGLAFGIREVVSFGFEVSKLAGQAEGVRNAFDRLPESKQLMDALKDSTHNTVSELELMKRAVQAQNFNIALGELPKLLEFASLRAQQTGQSVDYLVDSIVTGIGRKSPLILDNLGISAAQLSEEFKRTGNFSAAVGKIVDQELSKMPGFLDTAASDAERLNASLVDLQVELGNLLNSTGFVSDGINNIIDTIRAFNSLIQDNTALQEYVKYLFNIGQHLTGITAIKGLISLFDEPVKGAEDLLKKTQAIESTVKAAFDSGNIEAYIKALDQNIYKEEIIAAIRKQQSGIVGEEVRNLNFLRETLQLLKKDQGEQTGEALIGTNNRIKAIQEEIKVLEDLGAVSKNIGLIAGLEEKIKSLNEELKAATSIDQIIDIQLNIEQAQDQLQSFQDYANLFKISIPVEINTDLDLTPEDLKDTFAGITSFDKIDFSDAFAEAREAMESEFTAADESVTAVTDSIREKWAKSADDFLAFSNILSSGAQDIASGQQSAIQALQKATLQIIDLFLKQALAAAITKSITSGAPLPVGLALASVALGVVKGLFRKETGVGTGGGGSGSVQTTSATRNSAQATSQGIRVDFGKAEFKFNGRELEAALKAQQQLNGIIGG